MSFRRVDAALDRLMTAIRWALALGFVAAVALNFANVIARYVFNDAMLGADEVQIYIMVALAFLGAAVVSWHGRHLRMDVIARALPRRMQAALRAAEIVLVAVLAGFTAVQSSYYAEQMRALDRMSDNAGIPMWIPHGMVALGFGLIALIAIWRGIGGIRGQSAVGAGGRSEGKRA